MLLERVEIVGFRGINRLSLQLEQNNVLIGENAWDNVYAAQFLCWSRGLLLNREPLVRHEAHAVVWTASPFAGHNAYRFASDPYYANGFIPTVKQLVERLGTGY